MKEAGGSGRETQEEEEESKTSMKANAKDGIRKGKKRGRMKGRKRQKKSIHHAGIVPPKNHPDPPASSIIK